MTLKGFYHLIAARIRLSLFEITGSPRHFMAARHHMKISQIEIFGMTLEEWILKKTSEKKEENGHVNG